MSVYLILQNSFYKNLYCHHEFVGVAFPKTEIHTTHANHLFRSINVT